MRRQSDRSLVEPIAIVDRFFDKKRSKIPHFDSGPRNQFRIFGPISFRIVDLRCIFDKFWMRKVRKEEF